jgi:hypothetical protein
MDLLLNICTGIGAFLVFLTIVLMIWGLILTFTGKVNEKRDRDSLIKLLDPDERLKRVDELIRDLEKREVIDKGMETEDK